MAESIDYYMSHDERETIHEALKIALTLAEVEELKAALIYDKEKMSDWSHQAIRFREMLGQFD